MSSKVAPAGEKKDLSITLKKLSAEEAGEFVDIGSFSRVERSVLNSFHSSLTCYTFPQYELIFINDATKDIFECDESNILSIIQWMVAERLDKADLKKIHEKAISHGTNLKLLFDITFIKNSGRVVHLDTNLEYFSTTEGNKLAVVNCFDITERVELADLVDWERRQYREAFTANSEYHYGFDLTTGILEDDFEIKGYGHVSSLFDIHFPCNHDDFIALSSKRFDVKNNAGGNLDLIKRESLIKTFESGKTNFDFEVRSLTGRYSRISYLLSRRSDGHICAIVVSHDITDQRMAEIRKQKELEVINASLSEQIKITKSFSNIYFASWLVNIQEDTISEITVSKELSSIACKSHGKFSLAREIMIDFIAEPSKSLVRETLQTRTLFDRLSDSPTTSIEYRGVLNNWCRAVAIVIDRDKFGNPFNMIYAVRVISDEKQRELDQEESLRRALFAAKKANAAKTDFLARMSHDIRTPMNAIIGMTAIAKRNLSDQRKLSDCLEKISISSKHLLNLINEILDMSSIESGKVTIGQEEFNLPKLFDELLVMLHPRIKEKDHTFTASIEHVMHENVIADSLRLQQIFVTLLTNAIKYTDNGGKIKATLREVPSIMATNACDKSGVAYYEFVVEDNGRGIDKKNLDNLFLPFEYYDDERADERGSGLGLPIAKKIANMLGGDITVQSVLGEGSIFTLTFCLKVEEEREVDLTLLKGLKVVVTDDDKKSREETINLLLDMGLNTLTCSNCAACHESSGALEVIRRANGEGGFFIILSNYTPFERDGLKAIKAMRAASLENGSRIPLILYSSCGVSNVNMDTREAGADIFLEKPLYKSKLALVLLSLINRDDTQFNPQDKAKSLQYSGKRILLVDDNDLNRDVASEILLMMGLITETATDGKEAVDMFSSHPDGYYDLIFMDLQMPVLNGLDATRAIRSLPKETSLTIPIVAMSANAFTDDIQASLKAGMNGHIAKPLDLKVLGHVLEKYLT